ncbi:DNA-packaging protein gp3 [Sulfitobacter brevis]|uniref:DNA-packaging protein gp3 n=1 Tax=Sulfitobacter brevis TaxID=74348 RepID=A0A1I2GJ84_9RHOB|nr:terminase small subunit [Sulfitobacter brevis]SFF17020.1 DNA-packaging protein gp3 [Sulfitobacter brevis]
MAEHHNDRDDEGKFLPGNTIWQGRSTFGRNREYEDAQSLWQACCAYFQWAHDTPLYEAKILSSGQTVPAAKMRAFTQKALCLHLRISEETWRTWRNTRPDMAEVIQTVDDVIYSQKFEGAAAGLLNANLISRELGLADRQELTGKDGEAIQTADVTNIEVARRIAFILADAMNRKSNPTTTEFKE